MATKPAPVPADNGKDTSLKLSPAEEMANLISTYRRSLENGGSQPETNSQTGKPICNHCRNDYPLHRFEGAKEAPDLCLTCATRAEDFIRRHPTSYGQQQTTSRVMLALAAVANASWDGPGRKTRT